MSGPMLARCFPNFSVDGNLLCMLVKLYKFLASSQTHWVRSSRGPRKLFHLFVFYDWTRSSLLLLGFSLVVASGVTLWFQCIVQFRPGAQSRLTLCDPMDYSTPGLPVHHQVLEFTQTHVHWVGDAIQLSHPLPSPSPPAFNLSQHQGLFLVSSSHQVAKVLEFPLQHQSFQWIFRTDFL